jgi:asparagine synthase (glutamine-hydrolysing)
MCGLIGFTEAPGAPEEARRVAEAMLDAVAHRGPDGRATAVAGGATLGHCRLAFVDAEGGAQPFASASGRCTLAWNGEVYNHAQLRAELRAAGVALRTESDTELVVEMYEREGPSFVRRLRGMFALAIHDARDGRLLLARDPWGKKPLFFFETPGGVAFASELGALLRHPRAPRQVDAHAVLRYLLFGAVPAPDTALGGVHKVRPGSWAEWGPEGRSETVYWSFPAAGEPLDLPGAEVERRVEDALRAAVERRLRSTDHLLGVLLSGGVDSSLVAALAREAGAGPLPSFSAGFEDASFDETAHALAVARHLGTEHHAIRITGRDLAGVVAGEYGRMDEPLADPSLLPTLLVCREAGRHVRGVLSGDGADELFLGYRFFQAARALQAAERMLPRKLLDALARAADRAPVRHTNFHFGAVSRMLARAVGEAPERRYYASTSAFAPAEARALFTPEAWRGAAGDPWAELDAFVALAPGAGALERTQRGMIRHFLQDAILLKVDRGSMLNSVEVRSPFLDVELAGLLARVPAARKMGGRHGKHLLRRIAARHLPREVAWRTKQGFRAPVGRLLMAEARGLLQEALAPGRLAAHGLFRPQAVKALVDGHLAGRRDHTRKLWSLLAFQLWHDGLPLPLSTPLSATAAV